MDPESEFDYRHRSAEGCHSGLQNQDVSFDYQSDIGAPSGRPLSSDSGYGRPLPVPPSGTPRLSGGNLYHVSHPYPERLSDCDSMNSSPDRAHFLSGRHASRPQSYETVGRPLPEAPERSSNHLSRPSRSRIDHEDEYDDSEYLEHFKSAEDGYGDLPLPQQNLYEDDRRNKNHYPQGHFQNGHAARHYEPSLHELESAHNISVDDTRSCHSRYPNDPKRLSRSGLDYYQTALDQSPTVPSCEPYVGARYSTSDTRRSQSISKQVSDLSIHSSRTIHSRPESEYSEAYHQAIYDERYGTRRQQCQVSPDASPQLPRLLSVPLRRPPSLPRSDSRDSVNSSSSFTDRQHTRAQNSAGELLNLEEFITAHDPNSFDGLYTRRRGYTANPSGVTSSSAAATPLRSPSQQSRSPGKSTRQAGIRVGSALPSQMSRLEESSRTVGPHYMLKKTMSNSVSTGSASLALSLKAGPLRRPERTMTEVRLPERNVSRTQSTPSLSSTLTDFKALLPDIPQSLKKLSSAEYAQCVHVSSRSQIFHWLKKIGVVSDAEFLECTTGLFSHHIPTLSLQYLQKIALHLLQSYKSVGEIFPQPGDHHLISFKSSCGQGVLPVFTGAGCYSSRCHCASSASELRCYSSRCSRTIPGKYGRIGLAVASDDSDWAQYWGLKQDVEPLLSLEKREVQRQYQIHEVIYSEQDYMGDLTTLQDLYCHNLLATQHHDQEFVALLFGHIPALLQLSAHFLVPALKQRQSTQGPIVLGIGDIFLEWITSARVPYIEYAGRLRYADRAVRAQRLRSPVVRSWLAKCETDPRSKKLDFFSFQGAPTRRMQRYALLLSDVLKRTPSSSEDYEPLQAAIAKIKAVCLECDDQVRIAQDKISLMELHDVLVWKTPSKDLGLNEEARQIRYRGDLQRKSESLTSWQTRDVILLDNYLLCLKNLKDGPQKIISQPPIPIDYLLVDESDSVLYKSTSSKLLGGTITHAVSPFDQSARRPTAETAHTVSSGDNTSSISKGAGENLYPFTIRHAGRPDEKMVFYAESANVRTAWLATIHSVKAARWAKVAAREPFGVSIVADQAFAAPSHIVPVPRTEAEHVSVVHAAAAALSGPSSAHVSSSRVQCATLFQKRDGCEVLVVGTDDGVYSNYHDNQWTRILPLQRVTQIAVLEEFGVLTVLADKVLIAYTLSDLMQDSAARESPFRRPPQRLSGNRDVGFFEVGIMKSRMLVIYKKKDNGNSVFKCLEPVIGKKQEKKSFFKKGTGTEFFRDFDVSIDQLDDFNVY